MFLLSCGSPVKGGGILWSDPESSYIPVDIVTSQEKMSLGERVPSEKDWF